MNRIFLPAPVKALLRRLREAGFAAYAVGGCVRDSLLGNTPQDWDICTSARPEETKACFSDLPAILTGECYGTVTVLFGGEAYEITTFRAEESYADSRHPGKVTFLDSLRADLARRDFTVNAMAADERGAVTDCFGGLEDLNSGIIRCVGEPSERFSEDALRMLRALRFASRLGFSLEEETGAAIHRDKGRLLSVSPERLRKELTGLLLGESAGSVLEEFSDVLFLLIPELQPCKGFQQHNPHHVLDVWQHILRTLEAVERTEVLRLAALLHDIGKPACFTLDKQLIGHFYGHCITGAAMSEKILRRLRFDNHTVRAVTTLIGRHGSLPDPVEEKGLRRLLSRLGEEGTEQLIRLRRADRLGKGTEAEEAVEADTRKTEASLERILAEQPCFSLKHLAVNGRDLQELGISPGPKMGQLLNHLLEAVVEGYLPNDKAALTQYLRQLTGEK